MSLEREIATYQRLRQSLIAIGHEGKYVVIFGDTIVGIYNGIDEALTHGYSVCGSEPFYCHRVRSVEPVLSLSIGVMGSRPGPVDMDAVYAHEPIHAPDELLIDRIHGGFARSGAWQRIRKEHLAQFPTCAACGTTKFLNVHHVAPYFKRPELELTPSNLITLCETPTHNCHLIWGHLLSFKSWNENVREMAAAYLTALNNRPLP